MKIAVSGGGFWMAWAEPGILLGTEALVERARRADMYDRTVGGHRADLSTPHGAYRTMVGTIREYGGYHGPLELAAEDDAGQSITFVPEPDADSKSSG